MNARKLGADDEVEDEENEDQPDEPVVREPDED
jgi:hypothetical protein